MTYAVVVRRYERSSAFYILINSVRTSYIHSLSISIHGTTNHIFACIIPIVRKKVFIFYFWTQIYSANDKLRSHIMKLLHFILVLAIVGKYTSKWKSYSFGEFSFGLSYIEAHVAQARECHITVLCLFVLFVRWLVVFHSLPFAFRF